MFIKMFIHYLFAYSVDKAIMPTQRSWLGMLLVDHGSGPPWQPLRHSPQFPWG